MDVAARRRRRALELPRHCGAFLAKLIAALEHTPCYIQISRAVIISLSQEGFPIASCDRSRYPARS